MIKLTIVCTGRNSLKEKPYNFDEIEKYFKSIGEVQEFLIEQYGRMPAGRNKVFVDKAEGGEPIVVGFTHSFWNRDISHDSKPWYQTDWITATHVVETPVNLLSGK